VPAWLDKIKVTMTAVEDPAERPLPRTIEEIIERAQQRLSEPDAAYIAGAAETETTMRRNRDALDRLVLHPRVLRDVAEIDTSTELLGHRLRIPVVLAPLGSLRSIAPGGGLDVVDAARTFSTVAFVSTVLEPGFEAIAAATGAPKVAQLYVRGDAAWIDAMVDRIAAAGYQALCLTVDSAYYGRRERQLRAGWTPPSGEDLERIWQARLTWASVERIRARTSLPLVLKGVQTVEDARLAVEHGVEVVYVSNHGGRQLDHAAATMDVLPGIAEAAGDRCQLVVDGGFRRGTDVIKALCCGAQAVGIGRLVAWALAAGGVTCLVHALELVELELATAMGLLGVRSVAELDRNYVERVHALGPIDAPT